MTTGRFSPRRGFNTTTISIRFTDDELAQLDGLKKYGWEHRGDVVRDLIERETRRRNEERAAAEAEQAQHDAAAAIEAAPPPSYSPAGKTGRGRPRRARKTAAAAGGKTRGPSTGLTARPRRKTGRSSGRTRGAR